MRLTKDISDRLWQLVEPVVQETGLELVEIQSKQDGGRDILDIMIDGEAGITLADCALISEKVSLLLDVEDLFPQKYFLEVGSPGIFRELKKEKDFQRSIGKRVKARFKNPVQGERQFIGLLQSYGNQAVVLNNDSQELMVELANIKKIQLYPDI